MLLNIGPPVKERFLTLVTMGGAKYFSGLPAKKMLSRRMSWSAANVVWAIVLMCAEGHNSFQIGEI